MSVELHTVTPRQLATIIDDCIESRNVLNIVSDPGIGKSSIVKSRCKAWKLHLIDHRISTSVPEDFSGLPRMNDNGTATFAPFDIFPFEHTPVPEGHRGFALFLDEFNSGTMETQAAAYKPLLDREIGQMKLHPDTAIITAGNLMTSRAIVNELSTATRSRMVHVQLRHDYKEWLEDVAIAENYDPRIIAFHEMYGGEHLCDFKPDSKEKNFCCPRTWEHLNRFAILPSKQAAFSELDVTLFGGTISSGVAATFVQFSKVFEKLPSIAEIVSNPSGVDLHRSKELQWALATTLPVHCDDDNLPKVIEFMGRMEITLRAVFFRSLNVRKPQIRENPHFRKAFVEISNYLNNPT